MATNRTVVELNAELPWPPLSLLSIAADRTYGRIEYGPEIKMKAVSIDQGIVPLHEFKARAGRWLQRLRESGEPFVITHNGRPAGVVVSPEDYDEVIRRLAFEQEVALAQADYDAGRVYTTDEAREYLAQRRADRGK